MAKKSVIARNKKRIKISEKYFEKIAAKKAELQQLQKEPDENYDEIQALRTKLQALPRNARRVRVRNRCQLTGRGRGVYRKFGLSRIKLREWAMRGMVPGLVKASW